MGEGSTETRSWTIGIDVGDRSSEICVLDGSGTVRERKRAVTQRGALTEALRGYEGARALIEVGTHSAWLSRELRERFEVIVANPRRVRLISQSSSKSDRCDAELLARLGRIDPNLLSPIEHRGEQAQRDLALIRARDALVRARTQLINTARGLAKSLGERLPSCSAPSFAKRMQSMCESSPFPGLDALVRTIGQLTEQIRTLNGQVQEACVQRYPETARLQAVSGVGALTSLCYVLVIEDPERFSSSRSVGAYLGLRPRQRESGARRPQLRITKEGDGLLRRLLVTASQYILGPFGPACDLRRFGERLSERGGKAAKKRAVVAVARKLAVLLHRLWVSDQAYAPNRSGELASTAG
jgi:transposase